MNMRDYLTLHLRHILKYSNSTFIAVLHIFIMCIMLPVTPTSFTVKVLIFAASNFHGFSQLDKFVGTFFRIFLIA